MLPEESPEECAMREAREETALLVRNLGYHGVLHFYAGRNEPDWTVHIFSTHSFQGEEREREEGPLYWFEMKKIPYHEMWQDDAYWLPLLLQGRNFRGRFYFTNDWKRLVKHDLEIIPT